MSFRGDTSGSLIFTFGYPKETDQIEKVQAVLKENFHLDSSTKIGFSGFDRSKASSMQVRAHNTQLARFFKEQFYNGSGKNTAQFKRVPSFIYNSRYRWDFLKGYINDAYGEWGRYLRYSSRSKENLIDITWLGRISGIDSSCFDVESRFVWKKDLPQKLKTDLISAEPIIYLFKEKDDEIDFNWRYILRHQLYSQKSKRISKDLARDLLVKAEGKIGNSHVQKLLKLVDSPLSVVLIRQIDIEEYDNYVYDVSVPGSEMFWGGTAPILLHNSDTRGIDVIRTTVKNFARTMGLGDVPFKILVLDEADNMTSDAQQALRRTMEKYTRTCRFILIGNYSSKIIEPIQSRCSMFRFPPLSQKDVTKQLKNIAKREDVDLAEEGVKAILEGSRGDMRNSINILQAAAAFGDEIKAEVVYQVTGRVHPGEIRDMITYALKNSFMDAREQLHNLLIKYGLSGIDILKQMNSEIMNFKDDDLKVKLINLLGEAEFRLSEGANEEIQLNALLANIVLLGDKYKDAEL